MATIERALADEGPLTRPQLRERLDAAGVRTEGQALVHLLFLAAAARASSCAGRWSASEHAYVLVRDWLGPPAAGRPRRGAGRAGPPLPGRPRPGRRPRPRSLGGAAAARRPRRPGGDRLRAGRARGRPGRPRQAPAGRRAAAARACSAPSTRCCSAGPRASAVLGPHKRLVTINGIFRPFAMVDGRAVATWRLAGGEVTIEPLGQVTKKAAAALDADAADGGSWRRLAVRHS